MTTQNTEHQLRHKKKAYDATALFILAALFLGLMVVATFLFRGARIDLTENKLYTIAPGTKRVLATLDEPINLYFFFSQEPSRDLPAIRSYAQRVRELLQEMAQRLTEPEDQRIVREASEILSQWFPLKCPHCGKQTQELGPR